MFKLSVYAMITRDKEGDVEHLGMGFGDVDDEEAAKRRIYAGRVYGTLPRKIQQDTQRRSKSKKRLSLYLIFHFWVQVIP